MDARKNNKRKKNMKATNIKNNKTKKTNKNSRKKHPKLKLALKIFLIMFLLLCVITAGIVAAMFFGVFGDEFEITKEELTVGNSNTIVLDKDGNEIANLSTDEKRKTISISEMSPYLPKAYVAIEDKRFYSHNGVDLKRTTGAIVGAVTHRSSYGGSTITQQLVKNITNDKARTGVQGVTRKVKEWAKAVQVERMISKDQVLELYLNIIYVGGSNLHGVELGSVYYFNKSAKDLDLAECAFLAGINNAPMSYDPYDTTKDQEKLAKTRTDKTLTVLHEMKEQGFIENEEEYNAAIEKVKAGLKFEKGNTDSSSYSYHTDATIKAVIAQVMEEKNISEELAKNYIYGSGLTIYSTMDSSVQAAVEEEFAKEKYQIAGKEKNADGSLKNDHTQAGLVIIDNETSQVVAIGGKLGDKYTTGWNRGTQLKRQTGSSMKPLADIAPGLQEKIITPATVYNDVLTDFGGNYHPGDYNAPRGLINIRSCIKTSQNIPMVKIMRELTPAKSIEYLKKMGITSLTQKDENLALSIGGLDIGISPLEMAGAYSSIANDGVYTTPILYTKVVDKDGNTVLTPKQEKTRVISEQNAYLTRSITEEPVKAGGTATYCAIPGMQTCAKTGSTDEYKDRWLCGMTPYYSAACWWGFDNPEPLKYANGSTFSVDGKNPAGQLWSAVMKKIHTNLPNKNFNTPSSGLTQATICSATGCVATASCKDTYVETFAVENVPGKCTGHGVQKICKESGKIANEYCKDVEEVSFGGIIPKEQLGLWKAIGAGTNKAKEEVKDVCDIHKKEEEKPATPSTPSTTTTTTTDTTKKQNNPTSTDKKENEDNKDKTKETETKETENKNKNEKDKTTE